MIVADCEEDNGTDFCLLVGTQYSSSGENSFNDISPLNGNENNHSQEIITAGGESIIILIYKLFIHILDLTLREDVICIESEDEINHQFETCTRNGPEFENEHRSINEANDESEETEIDDSFGDEKTKKRRRGYVIKRKLQVLQRLEENNGNVSKTSRETLIPRGTIRLWRKEKEKIESMKNIYGGNTERKRVVRKDKSRFRPQMPQLEKDLKEWIASQRQRGRAVGLNDIKTKALELYDIHKERSDFSASNGWLQKFLIRNDLSMRRATSIGQKIPENAPQLALSFIDYIKEYNEKNKNFDIIYANMDEVPVWFDMPRCRTYEQKGVKNVQIKTTGHEKLRFTVVLTTYSDGRKCKPMIIFKGLKKVPRCAFPNDVVV
ncbi:pogo transposable element with KRAB domain-like protein, partial [Dinothrombium tinctorium]